MQVKQVEIYKVFSAQEITKDVRESIIDWYICGKEWYYEIKNSKYDLVNVLGSGRTSIAYRLYQPGHAHHNKVLKQFYPTKDYRRYKYLDANFRLKEARIYKEEFEQLLVDFIDSAISSQHLKETYASKGGTILLKHQLVMTSIGVCLLSDNLSGMSLDECIKKNPINTKDDLIRALRIVDRILCNDITVYHEAFDREKVHLDIKAENFWFCKIDIDDETNTIRCLDLGSVRSIEELILKDNIKLESSPASYSFDLIEQTMAQIKKCEKKEAFLILKQLDLLAVVKILLTWLFGEEILGLGKKEDLTSYEIVKKISQCMHGSTPKASFATWHIAWLFQKLLLTVNRIEHCQATEIPNFINAPVALSDVAVECQSNSLLNNNNVLTLSELKEYLDSIRKILTNEKSYTFNHANYSGFDHLLKSENITTMSALLKLINEKFGKYAIPPISIIEYLSYS